MSWRPLADPLYDDKSLMARFGYFISHELCHLNLALENGYNEFNTDDLLADYPCATDSTRDEAWADVCGTLGILNTGVLTSSQACSHISQTWVRAHSPFTVLFARRSH